MNQMSLFKEEVKISGLEYVPNYISDLEQMELLKLIDAQVWNLELKRRTQHYGFKYDYSARTIDKKSYLGNMPDWIEDLCARLYKESIFMAKPDQVIINEYLSGQGISPHIDCVPCFSDTICSLSLGSGCIMDFIHDSDKKQIYLEPTSLLILKSDARYKWKHGIAARKTDNGIKRERRVSLTFRKIILS